MKKCTKCGIDKELSEFEKGRCQCKTCRTVYQKAYNYSRKDKRKAYDYSRKDKRRASRETNKDKIKAYHKAYREANSDKKRDYRVANSDRRNELSRIRQKTDINFRIRNNLKGRLYKAIKDITKSASTIELLGCTVDFLKAHLKKLFTKGMTLENYGEWHIDHIIPCASFDLEIPEQQKICFNYRNLQPLWAKDNLSKGGKLPPNPQTSLPI